MLLHPLTNRHQSVTEHCVLFMCDSLFRSRGSGVCGEWGWNLRCSSCTSSLVRLEQAWGLFLPESAADDLWPRKETHTKTEKHTKTHYGDWWQWLITSVFFQLGEDKHDDVVCSPLLSSCWMLQILWRVLSQCGSECKTNPLFQGRNCKKNHTKSLYNLINTNKIPNTLFLL